MAIVYQRNTSEYLYVMLLEILGMSFFSILMKTASETMGSELED